MLNNYTVTVIDSMEAMGALSGPWNNLLMQSRSNTIFLTWEWLYTWAECFLRDGRKLFVLLVHDKDELVGIAPWYINLIKFGPFKLKQVEFLGAPETASDYLDVFTKERKEKDVALVIYHFLLGEASNKWNILRLRDIPSDSFFLLFFINKSKKDRKFYDINEGHFSPFVTLTDEKGNFIDSLFPSRRKRFMQEMRILQKEGPINHSSVAPPDGDNLLKSFFFIYKNRWDGAADTGLFTFSDKFAQRSAQKGWVRLELLNVNGKDIAGLLMLRYQDTISMYLMAVDRNYNKKV